MDFNTVCLYIMGWHEHCAVERTNMQLVAKGMNDVKRK